MYVYKITNTITGDFYIGQTIKSLQERFKEHVRKTNIKPDKKNYNGCPKLYNSIRKYGKQNFKIEKIDTANDLNDLNKKEQFWIKELKAIEKGLNLCSGGHFGMLSEESKKKISKAKKGNKARLGMKNSYKNRKLHSIRMSGSNNPFYNKPALNRKKILCNENGKVYNSIKEASDELGFLRGNMSKHLKGIRSCVNGYTFKQITEGSE